MKKVLVTGGAGYIGSHTVVELLNEGHEVVIFDNFSNSSRNVIDRIKKITSKAVDFIEGDICNRLDLKRAFDNYKFDAIMHFAGLKSVAEAEINPIKYYETNVVGSILLLQEMIKSDVDTLVFSSSATVYGGSSDVQYKENSLLAPVNVYGRTKLIVENVLSDIQRAQPKLRLAILRYFNPVGAHESGLIGESPLGVPNNLMPYIAQVAVGRRKKLSVFGGDYPTPDGTGLRDYIHVKDLALGHLEALKAIENLGLIKVNLGTGRPHSVLEMIRAFEKVSGKQIPYEIVQRRSGDLAEYYADSSYAKELMGWTAKFNIDRMCQDAWRWQQKNLRINHE